MLIEHSSLLPHCQSIGAQTVGCCTWQSRHHLITFVHMAVPPIEHLNVFLYSVSIKAVHACVLSLLLAFSQSCQCIHQAFIISF